MSELAILGGSKTRTEPYPAWPVWDQRDIDAVTEVIKSGRWGGYPYPGPKTAELARKFAELQGGGFADLLLLLQQRFMVYGFQNPPHGSTIGVKPVLRFVAVSLQAQCEPNSGCRIRTDRKQSRAP